MALYLFEVEMKLSALKSCYTTYRLTPEPWGDKYVMIDETKALKCFTFLNNYKPDNKLQEVELFKDEHNNFYIVLMQDVNLFMPCDDPALATHGIIATYGNWKKFED